MYSKHPYLIDVAAITNFQIGKIQYLCRHCWNHTKWKA